MAFFFVTFISLLPARWKTTTATTGRRVGKKYIKKTTKYSSRKQKKPMKSTAGRSTPGTLDSSKRNLQSVSWNKRKWVEEEEEEEEEDWNAFDQAATWRRCEFQTPPGCWNTRRCKMQRNLFLIMQQQQQQRRRRRRRRRT